LDALRIRKANYFFLQAGKREVDGVQIVGAEHLIPMKARARLDLTQRKTAGAQVDSSDIKKHRNDVFRLFAIVDPDFDGTVPDRVKADLGVFLERMRGETLNLKAMGLGSRTLDSVTAELTEIYGLGI
jgi:hypothetical protein